ncbi:MAG: V-type ATP synthase subunit F [Spirochaetota bacterium]
MASIAVVGKNRTLLGFKPYGVDVYFYQEKEDISEWFSSIVKKGYTLIMVSEAVADELSQEIDQLWQKELPVILTIKGLKGPTGTSFDRLRKLVIRAIGTDIFRES